jgi:hypothetical protein
MYPKSGRCKDPRTPAVRLDLKVRSAAVCEASVAAGWQVDDARESIPGVKWLGALRLILGGHSRAPRLSGPRLCAKHQSLRATLSRRVRTFSSLTFATVGVFDTQSGVRVDPHFQSHGWRRTQRFQEAQTPVESRTPPGRPRRETGTVLLCVFAALR